jgi:hypothetical protein
MEKEIKENMMNMYFDSQFYMKMIEYMDNNFSDGELSEEVISKILKMSGYISDTAKENLWKPLVDEDGNISSELYDYIKNKIDITDRRIIVCDDDGSVQCLYIGKDHVDERFYMLGEFPPDFDGYFDENNWLNDIGNYSYWHELFLPEDIIE